MDWLRNRTAILALLLAGALLLTAGCTAIDPNIHVIQPGETEYIDIGNLTVPTEEETVAAGATTTAYTTGETNGNTTSGSNTATRPAPVTPPASRPTSPKTVTHAVTKATTTTKAPAPTAKPSVVTPSGEMRGVWVSYIELNNLIGYKTVAQAQAAIDTIMENAVAYKMNTVFFHVRANSDAYYISKKAKFPPAASVKKLVEAGFDPLAYAVEAAHQRGLELHAWVNPYRIGTNKNNAVCPDYFGKTTDTTRYYYIPSSAAAQKKVLDGIRELMAYDIDGVHFDDYFYPAGMNANGPESFEKAAYGQSSLSIAEWRRTQVDALVSQVYRIVHKEHGKRFGISPAGNVSYNENTMYADTKKWLREPGYIDYLCPQIYYGFENQTAPFTKSLDMWLGFPRAAGVKLYVGLALYKTGWEKDSNAGSGGGEWKQHSDIMKRSVEALRARKACGGMVFYSYAHFSPAASRDVPYDKTVAAKEIENLLAIL